MSFVPFVEALKTAPLQHFFFSLNKEVIQPHLPVRLPCYDFTPLTSFTLVTFFPCGLDQPLRVLLTRVV